MYCRCGHESVVFTPSPCGRARSSEEALNVLLCLGRGAISIATRGLAGEGSVGVFGVCCLLHATRRSKRSCNCRKYGDYDVEDLAPNGIVVEGSHSLKLEDPQTPSAFQASPPLWGEGLARCFCARRGDIVGFC